MERNYLVYVEIIQLNVKLNFLIIVLNLNYFQYLELKELMDSHYVYVVVDVIEIVVEEIVDNLWLSDLVNKLKGKEE